MEGWIKLHRKFSNWEWADEPNMVSLFIHLLISASNRDTRWKGTELKRGQVIFGLNKWAEKTGISIQSLRTSIKKLKSTGELTIKVTSRYSIITLCNYEDYQRDERGEQQADQQPDQQATNKQLTSNQQHREKVKKVKKVKKKEQPTIEGLAPFLQ